MVLDDLVFDNRFTAALPADAEVGSRRRQVQGAAYSRVAPTPVAAPRTMAWSKEVAELLGLSVDDCASADFAQTFSGNRPLDGADPFAANYGGHQFGNWVGQLGDGRAIALGEVVDRNGGRQTLQLKGAGLTPYSRTADGRAVLRSSIREFLCSEAMHHLGVPTTRALSLVTTGDDVLRDMLYDGNVRPEPGAVVCRVAPSFLRFGSFQLPASRGDLGLLRRLVDFTIEHDFPAIAAEGGSPDAQCARWFAEVCDRTADLVVHWMRVGFVHGVLNTDNLSILGLTIDYGPYGWLEDFDPGWTPNTTDVGHRYAFGAQPQVAHWNLVQLANALLVLSDDVPPLQEAIEAYGHRYRDGYRSMMVERLGWGAPVEADDERLQQLHAVLQSTETDYVLFLRDLADVPVDPAATDDALLRPLSNVWYQPDKVVGEVRSDAVAWLRAWGERVRSAGVKDNDERRRIMNARNPRFVLRNWLAQEAIDAAETGDASLVHELFDVLRHPYDEQPGRERFAQRRPEWARSRVGCSALSCSS